ncbi:Receiver component of a two-component response regulator [Leptospira biflexa serovar Patoc strain 'Patoc 1 (Ames)']|uniref:Putative response regulatory protein n=1 Tax=Leptospira biflexa serovar Patoc (strain Patoc 1 / ATCC 23582 / Paris) TaxID=456481 RepID=B0STU3_LEPBP|nr:DNA-binding response regulator [Leptospira biflexa]ABZ95913.1 Receiver component of a two-component response regulator [Leptospira biflexa serovar Patoc strain 'Patoc 1 (Ames)']ABZ99627.1 Putative response regulatory protein [Leptospira biflexa serovar Patoc strain 'Patoc 1 (Paris)']
MNSILIGIIEDNLDYLNSLLEVLKPKESVSISTWNSAEDFYSNPPKEELQLLILDIGLPGESGIDVLKKYHTIDSRKSIVISSLQTDDVIFSAIKYGASGYIWKSELDSLWETIQTIVEGGSVISPSIATKVLLAFRKPELNPKPTFPPKNQTGLEILSPRERQILELIIEGDSPQQIAQLFGTTIGTVRQQIKTIYKKLQVNTRVQMLKKARLFGIF